MSKVGRLPMLMGRPPITHRTAISTATRHGPFKRTRPAASGGAYSDCPYPFVKLPHDPEPIRKMPFHYKMQYFLIIFGLFGATWVVILHPRDDYIYWARNESLRRRRERRERQEMYYLGIDENDVDPDLVREIDRLYVKGRDCDITVDSSIAPGR
ncbi:hypothetical protein DIPPA_25331 [Diplonema papillatum]|nr:hypothetical protein DIPPA_25331 [Diplonema papillatum]